MVALWKHYETANGTLGTSLVRLRTPWDCFGTIGTPLDESATSLPLLSYICIALGLLFRALVSLWNKSDNKSADLSSG